MSGEGDVPDPARMRETLKKVARALKDAKVPFALAGSYAGWARGGPAPLHDVDFFVTIDSVEAACAALEKADDFRVEVPPEDWLLKVWDRDVLVDLIWEYAGNPVTSELLERADELPVGSLVVPVITATDLLVSKLLPFTDTYCDFAGRLPEARALREQIDWADVRRRVEGNPYAEAFLFLLERLRIIEPP